MVEVKREDRNPWLLSIYLSIDLLSIYLSILIQLDRPDGQQQQHGGERHGDVGMWLGDRAEAHACIM